MKPNPFSKPATLRTISWKRAPDPDSRKERSRLLPEEETRIRTALGVAKIRYGSWKGVAAALKSNKRTITHLLCKTKRITGGYACRVARMLGVPLGDILSGKFPRPGQCPMCGAVTLNGRVAPPRRKGHLAG